MSTYTFNPSLRESAGVISMHVGSVTVQFLILISMTALVVGGCCQGEIKREVSERDLDNVIIHGRIEIRTANGTDYINGPSLVLDFLHQNTANQKLILRKYLDSPQKHVQYFAILALSQIADYESRSILKKWAEDHWDSDVNAAVIIATKLIRMNNFHLALAMVQHVDHAGRFAQIEVLSLGRHQFLMRNISWLKEEDIVSGLMRVKEFTSDLVLTYPFLRWTDW